MDRVAIQVSLAGSGWRDEPGCDKVKVLSPNPWYVLT